MSVLPTFHYLFPPLREVGYPFSAPKLILQKRLRRQLSVTTSISSPTSKRELSPNGLISCGQSNVERGRCNPVRKTTKILYASVAPSSHGCQMAIAGFLESYVFGPSGFWTTRSMVYKKHLYKKHRPHTRKFKKQYLVCIEKLRNSGS